VGISVNDGGLPDPQTLNTKRLAASNNHHNREDREMRRKWLFEMESRVVGNSPLFP